jgi:hypothetical protein
MPLVQGTVLYGERSCSTILNLVYITSHYIVATFVSVCPSAESSAGRYLPYLNVLGQVDWPIN